MSSSTSGGSGGGSARLQAAVDGTAVGGGGGGSEAGSGLRGCCSSRSSSPELEAELRQLLDTVCLPYLDSRVGGLDADLDWSHVLSLGEQQRLSFARLLHRRHDLERGGAEGLLGRQRRLLRGGDCSCSRMRHAGTSAAGATTAA